ncbi:SRPBCC domain-containing protein [Labrys sp. KNU-23]|uniref:SRPBCC family protein n=1 Tax=Labrys sp. KNU-23 TaxID=2789216 RepID=UPI0011EDB3A4|nr:SRPBCC domain-containing protein [Labrys sp. KNU-23]QEN86170.1 SRPBCC domain-containing protein [Labrys sp. KNU-23]
MTDRSYITSFMVDQTPAQAFAAIIDVRGWWSEEIEGGAGRVGEEFKYRFEDIHRCQIQVRELIPSRRIVWRVLDNYFSFTQDRSEWKGTDIIFEIARKGDQTEVTFTHLGLVPDYECYDACSEGWHTYVNGSLRDLIATGKGRPNVGEAITESEQLLTR